ncbi:hypothetical protein AB0L99_01035 [Streptomyces sp. NPDC051954]|uniref:hypothetical protein n=1 Tax=unclassified Streptomyces TaxID=2593676 RepID=UPI00342B909E
MAWALWSGVLAALDSPRPEASRLADLLEADGEAAEAAALIEAAGGRSAALAEARRHPAAAEVALSDADLRRSTVDELRSLLDFPVRRDL